jgi:hypothetical protein
VSLLIIPCTTTSCVITSGDIVRTEPGQYIYNPEKAAGCLTWSRFATDRQDSFNVMTSFAHDLTREEGSR